MARTYFAIDPIRHDGVDYAPGASIDLDAKAAKQLLAVGAIEVAEAATDPETDPEAGAPVDPNPPGDTGDIPVEAMHASPLQAGTAPQPANADADADAPVGAMHASPPQADADTDAPVPDATPRASVVPIGTKGGKGKAGKTAE